MECDHCGREPKGMAYTCSQCGENLCEDHRLPEAHRCPSLSAEKARQLEDSSEPWFKDEFRLSNVEQNQYSPSRERRRGESKPEVAATCDACGKGLFEHEIAGCPYCSEPYCGEHIAAHRSQCQEDTSEHGGSEPDSASGSDEDERWKPYDYDIDRAQRTDTNDQVQRWKGYGSQEQNDSHRPRRFYFIGFSLVALVILGLTLFVI